MANTRTEKLYKLLEGSITRYEGVENKEGARKVVTYEANGDAAGNEVWLTEREVQAVGLKKLEEVHGAMRDSQDTGKIAAPPAATSLTGAPAGAPAGEPVEGGGEGETGAAPGVNVGDVMNAPTSGNPAVARVLAKKAADGGK